MYHEITAKDERRKRRRILIALVVFVLLYAIAVAGLKAMQGASREQGAAALRASIMNSALRCCAIEGSYPLNLRHLEEDYGLRINHDDYIITYEAYASNMAPSVVVVPR